MSPHAGIKHIEHIRICSAKNTVCHWPLQGGFWYWGDEEILVGHIHAETDYTDPADKAHGEQGIFRKAVVRLQRSRDLGATWPAEDAIDLYDYRRYREEQIALLGIDPITRRPIRSNDEVERMDINMGRPDAILAFGRAFVGLPFIVAGRVYHRRVTYGFRSPDRGRTWESHPILVQPHYTRELFELGSCYQKLLDGTVLGFFVTGESPEGGDEVEGKLFPQLYASTDNGLTWHLVSNIYYDRNAPERCSYPALRILPSGRLLCTVGMWIGPASVRWIGITYSDDGGCTWSPVRRINRWAVSPYPVLMDDGRIVIVYYVRNQKPTRLACIVSEDEGSTWSEEIVLRDDAAHGDADGGYPVAAQLCDGRIFTAYYFQQDEDDVPWPGGRKHIAGTFFEVA